MNRKGYHGMTRLLNTIEWSRLKLSPGQRRSRSRSAVLQVLSWFSGARPSTIVAMTGLASDCSDIRDYYWSCCACCTVVAHT